MQSLASGRDLESIEQQVESGCSGPPRTGSVRAELRFSGLPERARGARCLPGRIGLRSAESLALQIMRVRFCEDDLCRLCVKFSGRPEKSSFVKKAAISK